MDPWSMFCLYPISLEYLYASRLLKFNILVRNHLIKQLKFRSSTELSKSQRGRIILT